MGITRKRRKKEQYDIKMIHQSFVTNLEGLGIFVNNVAPVVRKHDKATLEKGKTALEKVFKIVEAPENALKGRGSKEIKTKLTKKQMIQIVHALENLTRLSGPQIGLLYKSSFAMLVSYFDFLVSDLIHYFYQTYPESLSGKERSITLNELRLCHDLSEAVNYVVNKEIDSVLYETLDKQKTYFRSRLRIDTKENIIHWNKLNEVVERRNIIVHNDDKINRRYLKNTDSSVVPEKKKDLKEGKKITISPNYFASAFDEVLIAGIILIQCCWRKWRKDDVDSVDSALIKDIYDMLSKEEWTVAEKLGLFSQECKVCNERNRLYLDINYCQSLKWQNKKGELQEELKKFDMSTLSPIYVLALCALKSDRDNFYKNVEKAIIVDKMEKENFMEWPLFRELREDPAYGERIETAFVSVSQKEQE